MGPYEANQIIRLPEFLIPERTLTELLRLTGHPSLSQVIEGRGIPEASQVKDTEFFSSLWPLKVAHLDFKHAKYFFLKLFIFRLKSVPRIFHTLTLLLTSGTKQNQHSAFYTTAFQLFKFNLH